MHACIHTHVGMYTYCMCTCTHTIYVSIQYVKMVSCIYKTWYLFAHEKNVKFAFLHLLILLNMVFSCILSSNNKHTFVLLCGRLKPYCVYIPHVPYWFVCCLSVLSSAVVNVDMHGSLGYAGVQSIGYRPRNTTAGLYGTACLFRFLWNLHTDFHSG